MIPALEFPPELGNRIHCWAQYPPKRTFSLAELCHYLFQRYLADHYQINVAFRMFLAPRHRAINKGCRYSVRQRLQGRPQHLKNAYSFADQTSKFRIHRVLEIGFVKDLIACGETLYEPEL